MMVKAVRRYLLLRPSVASSCAHARPICALSQRRYSQVLMRTRGADFRSVALGKGTPAPTNAAHSLPSCSPVTDVEDAVETSNFAELSSDDLHGELLRFGRRGATAAHVRAVCSEVRRRSASAPTALLRDACYMCAQYSFHELCLSIYFGKQRAAASGTTAETRLPLYEVVVDAAFEVGNLAVVEDLAHEALNAVRLWKSEISELSIFRCFWRLVATHHANVRQQLSGRTERSKPKKEDKRFTSIVDGKPVCVLETARRIFMLLVEANEAVREGTDFESLLTTTQQLVRYSSSGDEGEMRYFQHIFTHFLHSHTFIRQGSDQHERTDDEGLPENKTTRRSLGRSGARSSNSQPTVTLTAGATAFLLRTCKASQCTDQMTVYFSHYTSNLTPNARGMVSPTEMVVQLYLQQLLDARKFKAVTTTAEDLQQRFNYKPGSSSLAVIVRAAGELRDRSLAILCLDQMLQLVHQKPTSFEVYVALVAIAKCGISAFPEILKSCTDNEVLTMKEEEALFLLLQYASNSTDPVSNCAAVLQPVAESSVVWSARVRNAVLGIHSRFHTDEFRRFYDFFYPMHASDSERRRAVDYLLAWATSRRYALTPTSRAEVVSLVQAAGAKLNDPRNSGEFERRLHLLLWDSSRDQGSDSMPNPEQDVAARFLILQQPGRPAVVTKGAILWPEEPRKEWPMAVHCPNAIDKLAALGLGKMRSRRLSRLQLDID